MRDGPCIWWYESGQKTVEGNYKDGKFDGVWTFSDEDGNITGTNTYKNGHLVQ
jgi:antitoxin component YwqK of YwqJK toxin-antitoxin module